MEHEKIKYDGNALSLAEQVSLLKARGLTIKDESFVKKCLLFTGFYRLFSYAKPLLNHAQNITFEQVWDLYVFDRKLRLLVNDAIERIEVAFRVSISEEMSIQHNPFWYLEAKLFASTKHHLDFLKQIIKLQESRKNPLIKNYYEKYAEPEFPPSWMIIECLTFWNLGQKFFIIYKNRHDKKIIASRLGQSFKTLESWIVSLIEIRNICAHHERLWNRNFHFPPRNAPNEIHQNEKFYQQASIIINLLITISPASDWKNHLYNLLKEYNHLPIDQMGFISNWQRDQLWQM